MKRLTIAAGALAAALCLAAGTAYAAVKTKVVEYRQGDQKLIGYLAWDDKKAGKRPGVVVYPEWAGLVDETKRRARLFAQLGYVAFAADIYGDGMQKQPGPEAGAEAGKYMRDRPLLRQRAAAALDTLRSQPNVDAAKLIAVGYCFGGGAALELARSGAPVAGTAVFHASLGTPTPQDAKNIKGRVVAFHGADDPLVNLQAVDAFQKEMKEGGVDYEIVLYGGALHSFTNPNANAPAQGAKYDEKADKRSWAAVRTFIRETTGR